MNWREATVERGQPVSEPRRSSATLSTTLTSSCSRCGVKLPGAIYESPKEVQRQIDTACCRLRRAWSIGPFLEHFAKPTASRRRPNSPTDAPRKPSNSASWTSRRRRRATNTSVRGGLDSATGAAGSGITVAAWTRTRLIIWYDWRARRRPSNPSPPPSPTSSKPTASRPPRTSSNATRPRRPVEFGVMDAAASQARYDHERVEDGFDTEPPR